MIILATFVTYRYEPGVPSLAHAWTEFERDDNPEGYEMTKAAAVAEDADEIVASATVEIKVDDAALMHRLNPPKLTLEGKIR